MTATIRNDPDLTTGHRHRYTKVQATLFNQMAKAGHHVHRLADGSFICAKYGMTRYCADFAELQQFAIRLGVLE